MTYNGVLTQTSVQENISDELVTRTAVQIITSDLALTQLSARRISLNGQVTQTVFQKPYCSEATQQLELCFRQCGLRSLP